MRAFTLFARLESSSNSSCSSAASCATVATVFRVDCSAARLSCFTDAAVCGGALGCGGFTCDALCCNVSCREVSCRGAVGVRVVVALGCGFAFATVAGLPGVPSGSLLQQRQSSVLQGRAFSTAAAGSSPGATCVAGVTGATAGAVVGAFGEWFNGCACNQRCALKPP